MTAARVSPAELLGDAHFLAALHAAEAAGEIPADILRTCASGGLFALGVPAAHGGLGVPLRERLDLHASLAGASASLYSVLIVHEMAAHAIARFGSPEQQAEWLEGMARGDRLGAFALTEPAGGSSFEQIEATAAAAAGGLRVHGVKRWVSSARHAGVVVTFARLDGEPVTLLVAGDAPGLTVAATPALRAFRATAMGELRLDGCPAAPLARPGLASLRLATACLTIGRVLVATGALAVAAAALEALAAHARERSVGSVALAAHGVVEQAAADAFVRLRAGQALAREAAAAVDAGAGDAVRLAIAAKLAATGACELATRHAVALHGAAGLTADAPVQRLAAEAAVYCTIEGSTAGLAAALGSDVLRREGRQR